MTRADYIRSMSDIELAKFLALFECAAYSRDNKQGFYLNFFNEWKNWLQEEMKEVNICDFGTKI